MSHPKESVPITFTDLLRGFFKSTLETVAGFVNRLGVSPNMITFAGLFGNLTAGILIATGRLFWGGLIALIVGPLDALDGVLARLRNESCEFGAFLDSVTDRYSEMALFGGLLVFFSISGEWHDLILTFIAAIGSLMVSYTRARSESLGYPVKIGILTRAERYIVMIPGIILGYPRVSLWIVAILANFTGLQRILFVQSRMREAKTNILKEKE